MTEVYPLRKLRRAAGLDVSQLSEMANVSKPEIYLLEQGKRMGQVATWISIADALDVALDPLIRRHVTCYYKEKAKRQA